MPDHPIAPLVADLSPAEAEQRAKDCFALEQEVRSCIAVGRAALWQMARALYQFNEAHGWTALDHENLGSWLADPDIGISAATYHRRVSIWQTVVVLGGVSEEEVSKLDQSKVAVVLPALKEREHSRDEILADVEALGWRDLRVKYPAKETVASTSASATRSTSQQQANEVLDEWRTKSSGPTANLSRAQLRVAGDAMAEFIAARYSS